MNKETAQALITRLFESDPSPDSIREAAAAAGLPELGEVATVGELVERVGLLALAEAVAKQSLYSRAELWSLGTASAVVGGEQPSGNKNALVEMLRQGLAAGGSGAPGIDGVSGAEEPPATSATTAPPATPDVPTTKPDPEKHVAEPPREQPTRSGPPSLTAKPTHEGRAHAATRPAERTEDGATVAQEVSEEVEPVPAVPQSMRAKAAEEGGAIEARSVRSVVRIAVPAGAAGPTIARIPAGVEFDPALHAAGEGAPATAPPPAAIQATAAKAPTSFSPAATRPAPVAAQSNGTPLAAALRADAAIVELQQFGVTLPLDDDNRELILKGGTHFRAWLGEVQQAIKG